MEDYRLMTYEFFNIPLPYDYDVLEPHIDAKTMHLHHDKHLQGYINNLNAALKPYPAYHNWTLKKLLVDLKTIYHPLQLQVQKHAGGVFNHFFYFEGLTNNFTPPSNKTEQLLNASFGSLDVFSKEFKDAALSVFGSGYAWLVLDNQNNAKIITTANQDCPLSIGLTPLLTVDVWEHAYYLKNYNDRNQYLDNFKKVINWDILESRLEQPT